MILFYSQQPRIKHNFTLDQQQQAADFYKAHPVLYNRKHMEFRKSDDKTALKQKLADEMGVSLARVEVWYNSSRSDLSRTLRKYNKSGGSQLTDLQKWRLKTLEFMISTIEHRQERDEVIPVS